MLKKTGRSQIFIDSKGDLGLGFRTKPRSNYQFSVPKRFFPAKGTVSVLSHLRMDTRMLRESPICTEAGLQSTIVNPFGRRSAII